MLLNEITDEEPFIIAMLQKLLDKGVAVFCTTQFKRMGQPGRVDTEVSQVDKISKTRPGPGVGANPDSYDMRYRERDPKTGTYPASKAMNTVMSQDELADAKLKKLDGGSYMFHLPNYGDFPKPPKEEDAPE